MAGLSQARPRPPVRRGLAAGGSHGMRFSSDPQMLVIVTVQAIVSLPASAGMRAYPRHRPPLLANPPAGWLIRLKAGPGLRGTARQPPAARSARGPHPVDAGLAGAGRIVDPGLADHAMPAGFVECPGHGKARWAACRRGAARPVRPGATGHAGCARHVPCHGGNVAGRDGHRPRPACTFRAFRMASRGPPPAPAPSPRYASTSDRGSLRLWHGPAGGYLNPQCRA